MTKSIEERVKDLEADLMSRAESATKVAGPPNASRTTTVLVLRQTATLIRTKFPELFGGGG